MAIISKCHLSLLRDIFVIMWLSALLVSALPSSYLLSTSQDAGDDSDSSTSFDLERLGSLLTEYRRSLDTLVDLKTKRYGFAGLDNLDVIHRVLDYQQQSENMAVNRDSKFSLRQLMERHG